MNICLCSMIDDFFYDGFVAFIKSLLLYNRKFSIPIVLIDVGLSKDNKDKCKQFYKNISFVLPQKDNYKDVNISKTQPCLRNTYYKLDAFNLPGYDRVVFIDLDTLVLDNINEIFHITAPFSAVRAYNFGQDKFRHDFNSGVFVLNKNCLPTDIYWKLIDVIKVGYTMPDQRCLNFYFKILTNWLPKIWNVEKRIFKSKTFGFQITPKNICTLKGERIKILHYVSQKPWCNKAKDEINKGYESLDSLWKYYYNL